MRLRSYRRIAVVRPKPRSKQNPTSATKAEPFVASGPLPVPRELLSAGVPLDPEVEIERQKRLEELKAKLLGMVARGEGARAVDEVLSVVVELERSNDRLAWRILRAERFRYGRSTERLSREELGQLFLALGGDQATEASSSELGVPAPEQPEQVDAPAPVEAEAANEPSKTEQGPQADKKKRKRVRSMKVDTSKVERKEERASIPTDERCCALCGGDKKLFGTSEHELFVFIPARIEVRAEVREKWSCPTCRKDVSVAPRSSTTDVVRKVDASLLAKLVRDKCALGLPLDRQRRELGRMGLDVPDKTMQSYWAYTTDLLEPIADAQLSVVLASAIVGADDTHLKTLDKSRKNGTFRGHIWCFVGTDGTVNGPENVAYGYTRSWEATEISDWFSAIDGDVQCDGYAGYAREIEPDDEDEAPFVAVPPERRLGCGMHIRSKFHAALLAKDRRAAIPLKVFADLYAIEDDCKKRGLDAAARGEERRRRSLPLVDTLDSWVDELHPRLLPKSPLRRATTYAINQRKFFRRCFSDGRFEIDSGRVERRIRPFAVARRNFLFTGSARGGERLAAAFTLVDSCLLLGLDPYEYLVDVIRKLEAGWPLKLLSDLIPSRWAAQRATHQAADQRGE
jgi:transposase